MSNSPGAKERSAPVDLDAIRKIGDPFMNAMADEIEALRDVAKAARAYRDCESRDAAERSDALCNALEKAGYR